MIKERGSAQSLELQKCQPRNEIKKIMEQSKTIQCSEVSNPNLDTRSHVRCPES